MLCVWSERVWWEKLYLTLFTPHIISSGSAELRASAPEGLAPLPNLATLK